MATNIQKLLIRIHLEQKENDALRDRIDGLELSLRTATHEREVLETKITSLEKKLLAQHTADPGLSASQKESLHQIKKEFFDILDDSYLTEARREFYERHIRELDTENLLILLRHMRFTDSAK